MRGRCPECGSDRVYKARRLDGTRKETEYWCRNCGEEFEGWWELNYTDETLVLADKKKLDDYVVERD